MKATYIEEPLLEFAGGGRHIDPRHGVWHYGPADIKDPTPRVVQAAIVGPQASIDGLQTWLDTCRRGIGAITDTHLTHLYVPFPGFDIHHGFRSIINFSPRLTRPITKRSRRARRTEPAAGSRASGRAVRHRASSPTRRTVL